MDYEATKFWFDVGQTLLMAVITIWMWASNRRSARKSEVDGQLTTLSNRVTIAEQKIEHAPDDKDLERIYDRMEQVSGELKGLVGEFQSVRRTLELMHEHLLSRAG